MVIAHIVLRWGVEEPVLFSSRLFMYIEHGAWFCSSSKIAWCLWPILRKLSKYIMPQISMCRTILMAYFIRHSSQDIVIFRAIHPTVRFGPFHKLSLLTFYGPPPFFSSPPISLSYFNLYKQSVHLFLGLPLGQLLVIICVLPPCILSTWDQLIAIFGTIEETSAFVPSGRIS